jgi:hypothetical protein
MNIRSLCLPLALSAMVVSLLGGCADSATRVPAFQAPSASSSTAARFGTQPVSVQVTLSNNAQGQLNDNAGFSAKQLQQTFENQLDAQKLLATPASSATMHLNVEVTDIRIRGSGTALFWGVLSGDDHIVGNVTLLDSNNQPIDKLEVSASYASDGVLGVGDKGRMGWLYDTFAKKALSAFKQGNGATQG